MSDNVQKVVIAGAGPAGLLLASLLLRRNDDEERKTKYKVTIVESREDLGQLDPETNLKVHKSWMIGLAGHGLEAVRRIPELYKDYVSHVGVRIRHVSIFLGATELKNEIPDEGGDGEAYIVDRNFVVASLARFIKDKHTGNKFLDSRYNTKLQYVDYENHQILTRNTETGKEEYIPYDLLVGADGVRSTVREALVKRHYDFELNVGDIFNNFKQVHVVRPKNMNANAMSILPDMFPHMNGIALPETDGTTNFGIGCTRNHFDSIAPELKSNDPKVVEEYLRKAVKCCELEDYADFAQQWASTPWRRTGMVHCNFYHSLPCKIVLMGDAAHATSPSIGMGMNTALRDAQKFDELLDKYDDSLEKVLPQFSQDRVKEGNSLSDLAFHLYCMDTKEQFKETIHMLVRGFFHKLMPKLVNPHPQMVIGSPKWTLASVYQLASDQGIISKHRSINDRIRQEYFELETGMLTRKPSSFPTWTAAIVVAVLSSLSYFYLSNHAAVFP